MEIFLGAIGNGSNVILALLGISPLSKRLKRPCLASISLIGGGINFNNIFKVIM